MRNKDVRGKEGTPKRKKGAKKKKNSCLKKAKKNTAGIINISTKRISRASGKRDDGRHVGYGNTVTPWFIVLCGSRPQTVPTVETGSKPTRKTSPRRAVDR